MLWRVYVMTVDVLTVSGSDGFLLRKKILMLWRVNILTGSDCDCRCYDCWSSDGKWLWLLMNWRVDVMTVDVLTGGDCDGRCPEMSMLWLSMSWRVDVMTDFVDVLTVVVLTCRCLGAFPSECGNYWGVSLVTGHTLEWLHGCSVHVT